jgi:3-mercaptopyruvate sulfurtransferase SseA
MPLIAALFASAPREQHPGEIEVAVDHRLNERSRVVADLGLLDVDARVEECFRGIDVAFTRGKRSGVMPPWVLRR